MEQKNTPDEFSGQIQRSVEAAVNSINQVVSDIKGTGNTARSNVRPLGEEVNQSVRSAVDEIKNQFYAVFQTTQEVNRRQSGVTMDPARYNRYGQQQQLKTQYQQRFRAMNPQPQPVQPLRVKKRAKKFPGEEANASGFIGWIIGAVLSSLVVIGCMEDGEGLGMTLFFALAAIGCGFGLVRNVRKRRQYNRFREYINRYSSQPAYSVLDIMNNFGYARKTVLADWREMIRLGIFPQASISADGQMIFLTNEAAMKYQNQYMMNNVGASAAMPGMNQTVQQPVRQAPAANQPQQPQTQPQKIAQSMAEVDQTLAKGKQYIAQIRTANDAIPGQVVSQKLDTLEDVCKRIFSVVEAHPEKLPEIRKFMDYYMPTTLKLVKTYREFDEQKLEGEQINQTKQDIEGTLDMINIAFANLLNDMYQDAAVQASADISVLSALFAQAGLKDSDFAKMPEAEQEQDGEYIYQEQPSVSNEIELKL